MSEPWKGLKKCTECQTVLKNWETSHWKDVAHRCTCTQFIPYDRRAPDPALAGLIEALTWIRDNCDGPAHGKARAALEAARKGTT